MLYRNFATTEEIDAEYNAAAYVGDPTPYFEFYIEQSAAARRDLACQLDVRFGPTVEETLDIFPAPDPAAPIVLFIHGGYWRRLSAREFSFVARGLVGRGITTIVTNYALCPKVTIPEITRQSRAAAAWARTTTHEFNGDRERLFVTGHSAGGHLAARVLTTDWPTNYGLPADTLKGAYLFSGIYDLQPIRYAFVQQALQLTEETVRGESPIMNLPAAAAPLVAEVGADESAEMRRQTHAFVDAWRAAGLRGEAQETAGRNHFDIVNALADPDSAVCDRIATMVGV